MTDAPEAAGREAALPRSIAARLWPFALGILTGLAFRFVFRNSGPGEAFEVMMASFTLLVPVVIGVVTIFAAERARGRSWSYYFWAAAGANTLFVIGTFLLYIEGLICTILAVPLFAVIGGVTGLITGAIIRRSRRPRPGVLSVAALPLLFGAFEQHLPLSQSVDTVERALLVDAAPEAIWDVIHGAEAIRPEEINGAWMYRIGVPLPLSALTTQVDGERVRHIEMGKGIAFDQPVVDWEPARRVRFGYRFTPESFPPRALDDHVRIGGRYFDLRDTEYRLDPTAGGTLISVRISYRVSTHFNWYARLVARLLVGNFEENALAFYAQRALLE